MDPVIGILSSALAALLGAWAGAQVAFSRYRSERSFDRQVDWYERTARAIRSCVDTLDAALFLEKHSRFDDAGAYWSKMSEHLARLSDAAAEGDLFATLDVRDEVAAAIHELNVIDRESQLDAKKDPVAARTRMANRMLLVLRRASVVSSNGLRRRLGLKPINTPIGPGDGAA